MLEQQLEAVIDETISTRKEWTVELLWERVFKEKLKRLSEYNSIRNTKDKREWKRKNRLHTYQYVRTRYPSKIAEKPPLVQTVTTFNLELMKSFTQLLSEMKPQQAVPPPQPNSNPTSFSEFSEENFRTYFERKFKDAALEKKIRFTTTKFPTGELKRYCNVNGIYYEEDANETKHRKV
jgi:hypothetical protein